MSKNHLWERKKTKKLRLHVVQYLEDLVTVCSNIAPWLLGLREEQSGSETDSEISVRSQHSVYPSVCLSVYLTVKLSPLSKQHPEPNVNKRVGSRGHVSRPAGRAPLRSADLSHWPRSHESRLAVVEVVDWPPFFFLLLLYAEQTLGYFCDVAGNRLFELHRRGLNLHYRYIQWNERQEDSDSVNTEKNKNDDEEWPDTQTGWSERTVQYLGKFASWHNSNGQMRRYSV